MGLKYLNLECLINDEEGKKWLKGNVAAIWELMQECVNNLKKWSVDNVWENIWAMNSAIWELMNLINEREVDRF